MASILVVDDAMFMRASIKKVLSEAGHTVAGEAENGRVALGLYAETKPDLVLLDITMPEMDGLTALAEIRAADPAARVVMCSALGQENKVKEALTNGAMDYVVKPFTPGKLLDAVTRALG